MPEYKRFIAYFYEYIDGKKQKNAGFAKVELRNGMWRILFRLNTETEPLRPVRAYGFVREQGWQLGLYMGSMRPGVVRMEEWAYRADIPVCFSCMLSVSRSVTCSDFSSLFSVFTASFGSASTNRSVKTGSSSHTVTYLLPSSL